MGEGPNSRPRRFLLVFWGGGVRGFSLFRKVSCLPWQNPAASSRWGTSAAGVPWGAGLPSVPVCGLLSVGGDERCPAGGSVAGVWWCSGGCGRPVSRGPGVRALVGVSGSPGEQREGRGRGGDCAVGCAVSVYVSARSGALAWSVVGRAVWRRSLPSSAAAARILQTSLRIWLTSW